MPRIPVYERGQVNAQPLPNVQMRQANFGRGVQAHDFTGLGNAIAGSANTLLRIEQKEQEEADTLRVEEQLNRLREVQIDLTAGQERGYQNQKGRNALDRPSKKPLSDEYMELFGKTTNEIESQLANDNQKQLFRRRAGVIANEFRAGVTRHESSQIEAYARSVDENTIKVETENAARNWNNPESIQLSVDRAKSALSRSYNREGLPADKYVEVERNVISGLHKGVIESALGAENVDYAKQYFEANKDTMNQADKLRIQGLIDKDMNQRMADDAAANVWQAFGPQDDTEAVNLDVMQAELREQLKDNPDALKIAQAELKDRASTFDYSVKQREAQVVGGVWEQVLAGQPLSAIRKSEFFRELDGAKQAQIIGQIETFRNGGEGGNANAKDILWAEYAGDSERLASMSDAEIYGLTKDIGRERVNSLIAKRDKMNSPEKIIEAKIDQDDFNQLAQGAGLKPFDSKKSESEKAQLGALKYKVENLINADQALKKRPLTREEKKQIMQEELDNKVIVSRFGPDREMPVALVETDDLGEAYVVVAGREVKIASIPAESRAKIIRQLRAAGMPVSEQAIAEAYVMTRNRSSMVNQIPQ